MIGRPVREPRAGRPGRGVAIATSREHRLERRAGLRLALRIQKQ
jgi:hypothetical protein